MGGFNNRNVLTHSSRDWESKIKVSGLVASEASLLGLQTVSLSLCLHVAFPLGAHMPGVSLLIRTPVISNYGPALTT